MNKTIVGVVLGIVIAVAAFLLLQNNQASAGPNGGDVVPLADGDAYAELLANSESGEVMVHTWDKDLKTAKPIKMEPITVGSGDQQVELMPHPMPSDPTGYCSRFYGQADWIRGGGVRSGWMHQTSHAQRRQEFEWQGSWNAGRKHNAMFTEMGKHHDRGGMGHGRSGDGTGHNHDPSHD